MLTTFRCTSKHAYLQEAQGARPPGYDLADWVNSDGCGTDTEDAIRDTEHSTTPSGHALHSSRKPTYADSVHQLCKPTVSAWLAQARYRHADHVVIHLAVYPRITRRRPAARSCSHACHIQKKVSRRQCSIFSNPPQGPRQTNLTCATVPPINEKAYRLPLPTPPTLECMLPANALQLLQPMPCSLTLLFDCSCGCPAPPTPPPLQLTVKLLHPMLSPCSPGQLIPNTVSLKVQVNSLQHEHIHKPQMM